MSREVDRDVHSSNLPQALYISILVLPQRTRQRFEYTLHILVCSSQTKWPGEQVYFHACEWHGGALPWGPFPRRVCLPGSCLSHTAVSSPNPDDVPRVWAAGTARPERCAASNGEFSREYETSLDELPAAYTVVRCKGAWGFGAWGRDGGC